MRSWSTKLGCLAVLAAWTLAQASCDDQALVALPDNAAGAAGDDSGQARAGAGGSSSAEAGGAGASFGPANDSPLGKACESDADCEQGLGCLTATTDLGPDVGSAPHGICTAPCQEDSTCQAWDASAACVGFSSVETDPGYCFQGCALGGNDPAAKCQGRSDFACQPLDAGAPAEELCAANDECPAGQSCVDERCSVVLCLPQCTADAECPEGRFCDVLWGTCSSAPQPESDLGKDCDIDLPEQQCLGTCAAVLSAQNTRVAMFCTEPCVVGYPCGNGKGACLFLDHDFDSSEGDIGYCAPACDCDDDCSTSGLACDADGAAFGRAGLCTYPFEDDGSPRETMACADG